MNNTATKSQNALGCKALYARGFDANDDATSIACTFSRGISSLEYK